MDTKIIEKIQKLLSLSESSNEHEAEVAMLKAQELLAKYKLSIKEVKEYKSYDSKIQEKVTDVTFTKAKWKAQLAKVISENFGCYVYYKRRRINTIVFFGREEDVIVCNLVLNYAVDSVYSVVKKLKYQYSKNGYSTRGIENDYSLGFIDGLEEKFEEQKRNNQEWGLVLVKDKEVVEAHEKIKFKKKVTMNTAYRGNEDAYSKGCEDGKKFSISNKITEGEKEETIQLH
ncbi:DUF2786 domain-containing protein [Clostridium felsineum]|uniref:DUF2786 domain-containing protein n=1 Tax=Clostridium felsineum TaxID=36839 RepID=UPI00214D9CAE|nr:DUF2786 domain-containing protein [Clostridium felsineum]MCR3758455.1 DUF2786 domain-containing protein [Clostridium felsineum]